MKVLPLLTAAGIFALGASGAMSARPVPSLRATHEVVATIHTGPSAAGLAFAARTGFLYVTNIFGDNVSVIDPRTRSVVDTVPLVGGNVCAHPFGVGYDKKHNIIYVACQQFTAATAIDARTNRPIGDPIEVGSSPFGIAYDERNGDVYVAIAHENDVAVVDGDTRKVIDRISVGEAPFGIAYDGRRGFLYVTNSQSDTVSVIDGATNTVVRTIPVAPGPLPAGLSPMGVVYDGRNDTMYVANFGGATVSAIDARTGELVSEIFVGGGPFGIALNERDGDIYVPTLFDGTVEVIDGDTNLDVESIPVGPGAVWAAADPRTGHVWVTHGDSVSELAARQGPPLLQIRPAIVNFGAQPVGSVESKFVTVTNVTGGPLLVAVTTVHVPDDFSAGGGLPGSTCPSPDQGLLGAGESCTQFVGFFPSEPFRGQHETGFLQVTAYDPLTGENLEEDSVALKGIPR
jgi:YVTN family beta-propeller protein